ncbi:hypothetical protein [Cryobacterium arcticum]|uniref:Uncharacterized protein n=1 Tax=Cryobacterium arcticum TaxID=670052 RepID=A0A317ZWG8_9MICO|nr:hypothetical protein [Cryobacterium arcticum]PXA71649.1 hypothetical protein CTB96_01600 [Cryobacterium arcticum]
MSALEPSGPIDAAASAALPPGWAPAAQEPTLVQFGDISISEHWLVTPAGTAPLRGTQIFVTDMTREERFIPAWAIVLAIIGFFFFFLGLLFLLVKETRISGFMQISVTNGAFSYQSAELSHGSRTNQLFELQNRANFARGVIARA